MGRKSLTGRDIEQLLYCSGPDWAGDGTKNTSTCPILDNRTVIASRYQCEYCSLKKDPRKVVLVDKSGFTTIGKQYYEEEERKQKIYLARKTSKKQEDLPPVLETKENQETLDDSPKISEPPISDHTESSRPSQNVGKKRIAKRRLPKL